ncbi:mandelate racemase/muconate lactonizing enzyme family protein [bacterium LRH843]|nr:mandelate racemase/muconate lactonizing enzyme family protein [bacterium LRH843]
MKIIDVKTHILSTELEQPFAFSQGWVDRRVAMIVEIKTDEGITGWGESINHGLQPPELSASVVEHALKPIILGKSPFDVEVLWETMYNSTRPFGQKGVVLYAISAIDIALWDIIGKAFKKPVHQLLGGAFRKEIEAYATGFYRTKNGNYPQDVVEEALRHKENGYKGMKLKTGFGIKEDIEDMVAVREAVGEDIKLMMDANCAYNVPAARRIIKELEHIKVHWFEEPISPEDIDGYCELKNLSSMYIAAGENEASKIGFRDWISRKAVDVLQPDLGSAGGFTECKKIAALAQAWQMTLIPHVWGTGIGLAAAVQFIATLPPQPLSLHPIEPMLEYDQSSHPFRQELINGALNLNRQGMVEVSDLPGIGVEIDQTVIEKYKVN